MEEDNLLPPPINFNCWKHHAGYIKEQIKNISKKSDISFLKKHLPKIGGSQMDLYFGKLTPTEISRQIISHQKKAKTFERKNYINWFKDDGGDYKLAQLSDNSIWTLRMSENKERYVHIHPGRYSPYTIRVKATTLKTAILILCYMQAGEVKLIETETVNYIRKKYLREPPIISLSSASGLGRLVDLFQN
jgi:hypothetical protein